MLLRAVEIWFVLLIMAVLNGSAREAFITPRFGGCAGHVISTIMLSSGIVFIAWMSIVWIGAESTADAFAIGSTWLLLTVGFEFVAGHYLFGNPWQKLFADYNIFQGRIWIVVLLTTLVAPIWATGSRSKRSLRSRLRLAGRVGRAVAKVVHRSAQRGGGRPPVCGNRPRQQAILPVGSGEGFLVTSASSCHGQAKEG
jgi:hypothetical protein